VLIPLFWAVGVHAQETDAPAEEPADSASGPIRSALLPPVAANADTSLGDAWNRLLRSRLEETDAIVIAEAPVLSLRDLQLSVGCLADTPACMQSIAQLLEVDALLVTTVNTADNTTVVTLTFHETAPPGRRSVARRSSGEGRERRLLGGLDAALEELFGIRLPSAPEGDLLSPRVVHQSPDGVSPWSFVLLGAGAIAAGTGVVFAALASSTENEWALAPTGTRDQVDRAVDLRDRGEGQALAANVLIISGAVLAAAGLTVLLLTLPGDADAEVHAWGAGDGAGLTLVGRFGGAL
jgi:hypothetical protein